ncbi:hypothetical protein MHU86_6568 [Fragilaria crotonensis]|nr:hypothetical protein MHU86_6568 [Fragilaria crotonensis]
MDDLFNCEADNLFQFLKDVQDRADEMGWTGGILNITLNADEPDEREENLIENYGTLTLEQVVISELQYIEEGETSTGHLHAIQVSYGLPDNRCQEESVHLVEPVSDW